jgi:hypothetical protein
MAHYRIPGLDLSTRLILALEVLTPIPERPWGHVTELAQTYGVSRTFLYELRERAFPALVQALAPRQPGPQPQPKALVIDKDFLRRAIAVLPVLKGSIRDIQQGLQLLFGVHRALGYISQTLQEVGAAAAACNASLSLSLPVLGEADELFQGRRPCLTVVDGRSFLVLHLSPAAARDGTTWGLTFLDLQKQGIQFQDLASDGARGIQAGVQEAQLAIPLRPDLFHLLREAYGLSQRLERAAYGAIQLAERARRAEQEAQAAKRRQGRPLKVTVPRPQAEVQEQQAIATYDTWDWLLKEVRQALEPITPEGRLTTVVEARATVETAAELLLELKHKAITAFARKLLKHLEELLAPLVWLEECLAPWRQELDATTEACIVWAWQQRQALHLEAGEGFPTALQPVVRAFWEALSLFHRSSSLAEALHSWLQPYLQIHRGMPKWLLPLLQVFWNHHPFQRGKRAGKSPLEMAGVGDVPSLPELLDRLLCPQPAQATA